MKTSDVTRDDLLRSVISVPPLAMGSDLQPDLTENRRLVDYMAAGGVTTFLYGGNANLYNIDLPRFARLLDLLEEIASEDGWMIPSIGPDYGKAKDQLAELRTRDFPTAMVLPLAFPTTSAGVASGLRKLSDAYGKPLIAYLKNDGYLAPEDLRRLLEDGVVCSVKYAVVRTDPSDDPDLRALVDTCGTAQIVSGIGERPAITHWTEFGLTGFTSGSVCVGPARSTALLAALKAGDLARAEALRAPFLPLEDLRDGYSPLTVLHAAVEEAGIARTGPLLPFLSAIDDTALLKRIREASLQLKALGTEIDTTKSGAATRAAV